MPYKEGGIEIRSLMRAVQFVLANSCQGVSAYNDQWVLPTWALEVLSRFMDTSCVGQGWLRKSDWKGRNPPDMWSCINMSLSTRERRQFNKWRARLYAHVVALDDAIGHNWGDERDWRLTTARKEANELMEAVGAIPWLKG